MQGEIHDAGSAKSARMSAEGGDRSDDGPSFEIIQDKTIKKWKTGVEEKQFEVKFNEHNAGEFHFFFLMLF